MQERDNLVLGLRIQAARHLVAKQDWRTAHELHGQGKAALLTSREDFHHPLTELLHAHLAEKTRDHCLAICCRETGHTEAS